MVTISTPLLIYQQLIYILQMLSYYVHAIITAFSFWELCGKSEYWHNYLKLVVVNCIVI